MVWISRSACVFWQYEVMAHLWLFAVSGLCGFWALLLPKYLWSFHTAAYDYLFGAGCAAVNVTNAGIKHYAMRVRIRARDFRPPGGPSVRSRTRECVFPC